MCGNRPDLARRQVDQFSSGAIPVPATQRKPITIDSLDHLVLTVASLKVTSDFYVEALGMRLIEFEDGRQALRFGAQKINLHETGHEFEPKSEFPTPGSGDLCFITTTPLADFVEHFDILGIPLLDGPVERTGAVGKLLSIYIRDPDKNLIEISNSID